MLVVPAVGAVAILLMAAGGMLEVLAFLVFRSVKSGDQDNGMGAGCAATLMSAFFAILGALIIYVGLSGIGYEGR